jgi:hypothetical protein
LHWVSSNPLINSHYPFKLFHTWTCLLCFPWYSSSKKILTIFLDLVNHSLVVLILPNAFHWCSICNLYVHIYLWSKVVCLLCFVPMRSTELGCFRSRTWSVWKALKERGAWAWFHGVCTCSVEVLEYWMISSLKIKLDHSWKFQRNWNVPLVLLERSWWAGFNGIYLVRFGFRMWEILICKWFLPLKIQLNEVLEGKISWVHGNMWPTAQATQVID